jgi:hypothetical protein
MTAMMFEQVRADELAERRSGFSRAQPVLVMTVSSGSDVAIRHSP